MKKLKFLLLSLSIGSQTTAQLTSRVAIDLKDDKIDLATYSSKVRQCCQEGTNHAVDYGACYNLRKVNQRAFPVVHQSCEVARNECCNRQLSSDECNRGITNARYLHSCNIYDIKSLSMNKKYQSASCEDGVTRTCCNCCWIGMKVFHELEQERLRNVDTAKTSRNSFCESMSDFFKDSCKTAFTKCCKSGPKSQGSWRYQDINALAPFEELKMMPCKQGFKRNKNTGQCEDINECAFNPCDPGYACINLVGGWTCQRVITCGTGYYLAGNNTCIDIDECAQGQASCPKGTRCVNKQGTYKCQPIQCRTGHRGDAAGNCKDIDECAENTHGCPTDSKCENQDGGFTCRCNKGYRFDPRRNTCEDIDECRERSHNCPSATHGCRNKPGTFVCLKRRMRCRQGMKPDKYNRRCVDINECLNPALNTCDIKTEKCMNIVGSYTCEKYMVCQPGTYLNSIDNVCLDIDECRRRRHNCSRGQRCVNTFGSFTCVTDGCSPGFKHANTTENNFNCVDIDECSESIVNPCGVQANGQPLGKCRNTRGSYTCYCKQGYQFDSIESTCTDIDECRGREHNTCDHECVNSEGSYSCTCPAGYKLDDRTKGKCLDVNECWNDYQPTDICSTTEQVFADTSLSNVCFNTLGSHFCQPSKCPDGYELSHLKTGIQCTRTCTYYGTVTEAQPENTCTNLASIHISIKSIPSIPTFEKYANMTQNRYKYGVLTFNAPNNYNSITITKWQAIDTENDKIDKMMSEFHAAAIKIDASNFDSMLEEESQTQPLTYEQEIALANQKIEFDATSIQSRKTFKLTNKGRQGSYSGIFLQKPIAGPVRYLTKIMSTTSNKIYYKGNYLTVAENYVRYILIDISENEF